MKTCIGPTWLNCILLVKEFVNKKCFSPTKGKSLLGLNLFHSLIVLTNIHKHIQFNTITYTPGGKRGRVTN